MNNLQQAAHSLGIDITDEQSAEFEKYMEMMLEYNKCVNLTAITEKEEIEEKHFVDSVSAVLSVSRPDFEPQTLCIALLWP